MLTAARREHSPSAASWGRLHTYQAPFPQCGISNSVLALTASANI